MRSTTALGTTVQKKSWKYYLKYMFFSWVYLWPIFLVHEFLDWSCHKHN